MDTVVEVFEDLVLRALRGQLSEMLLFLWFAFHKFVDECYDQLEGKCTIFEYRLENGRTAVQFFCQIKEAMLDSSP